MMLLHTVFGSWSRSIRSFSFCLRSALRIPEPVAIGDLSGRSRHSLSRCSWRCMGFRILSNVLIFGGFILLAASWRVLYAAQQKHQLATTGPYGYVRHPQYGGFMLIMLGFLLQWPTLPTLVMFPILVYMYLRLAHREERDVLAEFGEPYARYAKVTPAFFPRLSKHVDRSDTSVYGRIIRKE